MCRHERICDKWSRWMPKLAVDPWQGSADLCLRCMRVVWVYWTVHADGPLVMACLIGEVPRKVPKRHRKWDRRPKLVKVKPARSKYGHVLSAARPGRVTKVL